MPNNKYSLCFLLSALCYDYLLLDVVLCIAPLQVQFVSNTPVVQGGNIHAVFKISRSAMQVTCNLIPAASGKVNCKFFTKWNTKLG